MYQNVCRICSSHRFVKLEHTDYHTNRAELRAERDTDVGMIDICNVPEPRRWCRDEAAL